MSYLSEFLKSIPEDQFKAVFSFIIMLPIGWSMRLLQCPKLRLAYSLVLGLVMQFYIYGWTMLHVFVASVVNLLLIKYCEPGKVGKVALIYNFSHNSYIHLYRFFFNYDTWSIEISLIFMMVMCKLSGFAYAYQDAYNYSKDNKSITESQKKYMIEHFSNFEFFSYIYFVSSSIIGTFIEFRDFMNFIHLKEQYKKIPSTILAALNRILVGFFFYGIYTALNGLVLPDDIADEERKFSFAQRAIMFVMGIVHEYKYIGGFCLSEAGLIASGISYNGEAEDQKGNNSLSNGNSQPHRAKEHDRWGTGRSVSIIDLHLVYKPSEFFQNWNISVHTFLKRYVYVRLLPANTKSDFTQKQFAASVTFFASSIWHGFHPTYFVTFFHFYLFTLLETQIIKVFVGLDNRTAENINDKGRNLKNKIWIYIFRLFVLLILVPFHCLMFASLDSKKLFKFLKNINYFGTIIVILPNVILMLYSSLCLRKRRHGVERNEKLVKNSNTEKIEKKQI
jgi:lysophospholipid acyltransferase